MNRPVAQWRYGLKPLFAMVLLAVFSTVAWSDVAPEASETSPALSTALVLPAEFSRFVRISYDQAHKPLSMQVAILRFAPDNAASGMDYVDLISAVHIGEKDYYQYINQRFTTYDAVLYELVAPEGTRIPRGEKKHKSIISGLQSSMRNMLGMSMQLEEVDYSADNLVHADLSPQQFRKSMSQRNESVSGMIGKAWMVSLGQQYSHKSLASEIRFYRNLISGSRELAMKIFAAEQMVQSIGVGEAFEGADGSTLVSERNKKALQVLQQEIDAGKKTLAIFYGAAHMKDMAQRLVSELHFKPVKIEWVDAWNLR